MSNSQGEFKTGLIGFFDILGYGELIGKNDLRYCASVIEAIVLRAPHHAQHLIARKLSESNSEALKPCFEQPIIFSDTVVFPFRIIHELEVKPGVLAGVEIQWFTFFILCLSFQRLMFLSGLPVRGAISYGEYYTNNACFAGKPIIDAYKISGQIQLVSCAITPDCAELMPKGDLAGVNVNEGLLLRYSTPVKAEAPLDLFLTNWSHPGGNLFQPFPDDFAAEILKSFTAHNKSISRAVDGKRLNTELFLNACQARQTEWNKKYPGPV
jgi:hypothetical protein